MRVTIEVLSLITCISLKFAKRDYLYLYTVKQSQRRHLLAAHRIVHKQTDELLTPQETPDDDHTNH